MKNFIKGCVINISSMLSFIYKNEDISFIYYHDVVEDNGFRYQKIEISTFIEQMNYIYKNGFKTLLFRDLNNEHESGDRKVLISFDDGYRSNYEVVFPIMKRLKLKFNVFLEVGAIDKDPKYLTWDMIRRMKYSGLVDFGAHTYNHVDLRDIENNDMEIEIFKANEEISKNVEMSVEDFCFPFGAYNKNIINYLVSLGVYKRLYTSDGIRKIVKNNTTIYGRIGVENDDSLEVFRKKLQGKYNLYYKMSRNFRELTNS